MINRPKVPHLTDSQHNLKSVKKVANDGGGDRFVKGIDPAGPKRGSVWRLGIKDAEYATSTQPESLQSSA